MERKKRTGVFLMCRSGDASMCLFPMHCLLVANLQLSHFKYEHATIDLQKKMAKIHTSEKKKYIGFEVQKLQSQCVMGMYPAVPPSHMWEL